MPTLAIFASLKKKTSMINVTNQQLEEIVEFMDAGLRVFIHKQEGELLTLPGLSQMEYADMEDYQEEMDEIEAHPDDYVAIEEMDSEDSFQIMSDYVDELGDRHKIKGALLAALDGPRPFRAFLDLIESSPLKDEWFTYKLNKIKERVLTQLKQADGSVEEE